jgi:predicted flavoprotein YhiN
LRDSIRANGAAELTLDLAPDWTLKRLTAALAHPRGSRSLSSHLQSRAGITGVRAGLLRELVPADQMQDPEHLSKIIKQLPVILKVIRPIDEAISSAGGVSFKAIDTNQMLRSVPGVFCAGEMLDWEAPTGGYLLSACFASGRAAGTGAALWLAGT